ncbi:MAG: ATP-binding cassette domain-containing protein [Tissierellia bacterium]|nr:ATP-binding cassette domain-containing protein [Tissierellia bacterium]
MEFGFDDNIIISNFSCTFSKGKIYALVGENGCGKSTFLDIIIGLYKDKINGNVYFNDEEIRDIDMNLCRRNLIAISDQNNILIKDTILNNIIIGLSNSNGYTKKAQIN